MLHTKLEDLFNSLLEYLPAGIVEQINTRGQLLRAGGIVSLPGLVHQMKQTVAALDGAIMDLVVTGYCDKKMVVQLVADLLPDGCREQGRGFVPPIEYQGIKGAAMVGLLLKSLCLRVEEVYQVLLRIADDGSCIQLLVGKEFLVYDNGAFCGGKHKDTGEVVCDSLLQPMSVGCVEENRLVLTIFLINAD